MKTRFVSILTVMLVLSLMLLPATALADTTAVTGEVADTPTITNISPDNGDNGTAPTVIILGTNFIDGETTINVSGTGVTAGAVTFTSSSNISATFTIDSDATAGDRDVTVIVAGKTSSAATFTVNYVFDVTAPSAIDLGLMTAGVTNYGSSSVSGNVSTNASVWTVDVMDTTTPDPNKGYMTKAGPVKLSEKFQIKKSEAASYSPADSGYTQTQADGTNLGLYVGQEVTQGDPAGSYTITITFTGSPL